MSNYCPDCGKVVNGHKCGCGWHEEEVKTANRNCAYSDQQVQCPLLGTMADTAKPNENTKWYCRYHIGWYDNPREASQNLTAILNGDLKLTNSNWQEDAITEKTNQLRETNSELFFQPNNQEEREDYATMCINFIKHQANVGELPYKKQRSQINVKEEVLDGIKPITDEQIENADLSRYFDEPVESY